MVKEMNKRNLFIFSFKQTYILGGKLFVLLSILFMFFCYISPQYSQGYNASLIDKVKRLESIDSSKIVLIGNSNLSFGIRSEEIEAAFGMPVVNMGLHGGLGNAFHERMATLNVHEGDIYIICHTDFSDSGYMEPAEADLAWITLEDHFNLWRILRKEDIRPMVEAFPNYLKRCITLWINGEGNKKDATLDFYNRSVLNEYGDISWDDTGLEYQALDWNKTDISVPSISDNVVLRLNELNMYLEERGATMVIAAYPIADSFNTPDLDLYIKFQDELSDKLDAAVISNYADYFYPERFFFNTKFHLNNEGKSVRTQQLIADLNHYFTTQ